MKRRFNVSIMLAFLCAGGMAADGVRANVAPPIVEFHLGVRVEMTDAGARVTYVAKDEAADKAGIKQGDVILAIDKHYAKSLSKADVKSFAEDVHVWPVDIILVRDGKDVMEMRIRD